MHWVQINYQQVQIIAIRMTKTNAKKLWKLFSFEMTEEDMTAFF